MNSVHSSPPPFHPWFNDMNNLQLDPIVGWVRGGGSRVQTYSIKNREYVLTSSLREAAKKFFF